MNVLKGPRIELRTLEPTMENAVMILEVVQKNREHFKFLSQFIYMDKKDTLVYLTAAKHREHNKGGLSFYVFKDDALIGEIQSKYFPTSREMGYWIDKEHLRQGYASEALGLMEHFLFSIQKTPLILNIKPDNYASLKLAKKAGYTKDKDGFYIKNYFRYRRILEKNVRVQTNPLKIASYQFEKKYDVGNFYS